MSIVAYVIGRCECSQQRSRLKWDGYEKKARLRKRAMQQVEGVLQKNPGNMLKQQQNLALTQISLLSEPY